MKEKKPTLLSLLLVIAIALGVIVFLDRRMDEDYSADPPSMCPLQFAYDPNGSGYCMGYCWGGSTHGGPGVAGPFPDACCEGAVPCRDYL